MKTRTDQTGEVDWKKVKNFIGRIFPELESKIISAFEELETLEPCLIEGYSPSSIHLRFVKKDRRNLDLEKGNLDDKDIKLLIKQQPYISKTLAEIAELYNLDVVKGIRSKNYRGRSVTIPGIGLYTFKPKYSEFVK